jgi:hypothetical protein
MAAVNPKVRWTPSGALPKVQLKAPVSQTWKAGEFGVLSSGEIIPAVTGSIPYCIFAETQSTATTASELVWVYLLEVGTQLEIFVTNNGTDAVETDLTIGGLYDLYVASNKHYIDVNASTDDTFRVLKYASEYEEAMHDATDSPGKVLVSVEKVV